MTPLNLVPRLAAAAIAVLVTTSTVWGMAKLAYPASDPTLLSAKQVCARS
jgi:hypothetical protein